MWENTSPGKDCIDGDVEADISIEVDFLVVRPEVLVRTKEDSRVTNGFPRH